MKTITKAAFLFIASVIGAVALLSLFGMTEGIISDIGPIAFVILVAVVILIGVIVLVSLPYILLSWESRYRDYAEHIGPSADPDEE